MGSSATINKVRFTFSLVHRNQRNVSWCNGKHLVYIQPDASPRFPFFWNEFYRGFVVYCLPSADHLEALFHLFLGSCYRKTAGKALEKDYRIIFIFDIFGFLLTISDASPVQSRKYICFLSQTLSICIFVNSLPPAYNVVAISRFLPVEANQQGL
ncbi:hypothetical protein T02_4030 [Trichinella nativa]|uniref:Uncharacterized protein n=1 Tax=Trichinella nativa TaxID=6335 RepID=A0A0V1LHG7_9BILA|nr:hypothetical protein T02_4030 [Trichinella nativa]